MKIRKEFLCIFLALCLLFSTTGCAVLSEQSSKVRDLEMTVMSRETIPEGLLKILNEKKSRPFQLTYKDEEHLYICIGYGEKDTDGYSVAVDELYLTEESVCVKTTLLGPDAAQRENKVATYPMIVIRTELLEKPVIFG